MEYTGANYGLLDDTRGSYGLAANHGLLDDTGANFFLLWKLYLLKEWITLDLFTVFWMTLQITMVFYYCVLNGTGAKWFLEYTHANNNILVDFGANMVSYMTLEQINIFWLTH